MTGIPIDKDGHPVMPRRTAARWPLSPKQMERSHQRLKLKRLEDFVAEMDRKERDQKIEQEARRIELEKLEATLRRFDRKDG